jgi:hypothetical protein
MAFLLLSKTPILRGGKPTNLTTLIKSRPKVGFPDRRASPFPVIEENRKFPEYGVV